MFKKKKKGKTMEECAIVWRRISGTKEPIYTREDVSIIRKNNKASTINESIVCWPVRCVRIVVLLIRILTILVINNA